MIRYLSLFGVLAVLGLATPTIAAPRAGEKNDGPAVVGQAKSLNDLLKLAKEMVKAMGGDELYQTFEQNALPNLDPKQLPGIDPTKPFGLYGNVEGEVLESRGVLLIPATSPEEFIKMLEATEIKVEKGTEAGLYTLIPPGMFPIPIALKFHKSYAYVSIGGSDALAAKALIDPEIVISDKEKSIAYLGIKVDRIPKKTKEFIVSSLGEQTMHLRDGIPDEDLKGVAVLFDKLYVRWLKTLFDEGKEVAVRLEADAKTGVVSTEFSVEGIKKSFLADAIAKREPTKNAFASISGDDYVQRVFMTAPLFADEVKEALSKLSDYGSTHLVAKAQAEKAPEQAIALLQAGFKSLKSTVESGEMDFALALRGPNKDGIYSIVSAMHLRDATTVEKAFREAVKIIPDPPKSWIKLDTAKEGEINIHEFDASSEAPEPLKNLFGDAQKIYFAFGPKGVYVTYGPEGMKLMKEAINAKPGLAASFESVANGKKTGDFVKKMLPKDDPNAATMLRAMGLQEAGLAGMLVKIDSGDKLKLRIGYNLSSMGMWLGTRGTAGKAVPLPAKE